VSEPVEADFAIIKVQTAEGPPAVFTQLCGIENVTRQNAAAGNDRYRRDCTKMGRPAVRKNRITGKSQTISGSGAMNIPDFARFETLLGVKENYEIEFRQNDDTDAGKLLGTYAGVYVLMSDNAGADVNGDSTGDITLNNDGPWTWTPAP